jgi:hypothetical protein
MPRRLIKLVSPLIATVLAAGLYAQMRSYAVADDTTPFHRRVADAVDKIPFRNGPWEGTEAKPPDAAGQLLRPNALRAIRYRDLKSGRWASLIVIHCRDSRDMSGHYPPNCYRGSGWTQAGPPDIREYKLWDRTVPIAAYEFSRAEFDRVNNWVVYDFFVLPTGEFVTDMESVRTASGDYRTRPYGCAQIQVLMDSGTPKDDQQAILNELLEPIGPVIKELQATRSGARQ